MEDERGRKEQKERKKGNDKSVRRKKQEGERVEEVE